MCITKTRLMVVGAMTGGLLFAATLRPTHVFALNDSSSSISDPTATTTATPDNSSDDSDTTPPTPTDPTNSSVADGSTATQDDTSTIGSDSSSTTTPTDPTSTNTTDPDDDTGDTSQTGIDNSTAQNDNTTDVDNSIDGTAQSGNASVADSQQGGDATTGDAADTATIVNAVTSSVSGGLQSFTINLNGDQNGNVLLNLGSVLSADNNVTPSSSNPGSSSTNSQNNLTVNNDVNLAATTGNATVSGNGVGGNATTGNALTEADVINLLTALISDNQSFIGTININGNLNGNILIPAGLIDSLLNPTTTADASTSGDTDANNDISINNDVSLTAASGTASTINNGVSGDATSGNATTTLDMYNLINSQIVGGNVLLVFVNVVGSWYGLLLNAPAGTTTTALGGGIQQDTASYSQTAATNTISINNVINLYSTTGAAMVSDNGVGGDATTGNATAIADIANIVNSQINLSGWLGILIINVFGTWNGSLAIQTSAPLSHPGDPANHRNHNITGGPSAAGVYYVIIPTQTDQIVEASAHVLGASTGSLTGLSSNIPRLSTKKTDSKGLIVGIILAVALALMVVLVGRKFSGKKDHVK